MSVLSALSTLAIAASTALHAHDKAHTKPIGAGEVPFELVGQVQNVVGTPTSLQFGYLSAIEGLEDIFTTTDPALQNEATALFTFFNESATERVIANGNLRIINRVGTTTIYFDETPDGDFVNPNPESFADGVPIQTSTFTHQVILDATTGTFTTVFVSEVTAAESFTFNGERVRLGNLHDKLRIWVSGVPIDPPARFEIAGYAVEAGAGN